MKENVIAVSIAFVMVFSILGIALVPSVSSMELPEYIGVDWQSGLAGEVEMPAIEDAGASGVSGVMSFGQIQSTPPVGTWVYDWYLGALTGYPDMQLRAVGGNAEVWVGNNETLKFLPGDPRNDDPLNWYVTDEMCQFIAEEFNTVIYPTDTYYFGAPFDRDGTSTIFEALGWPPFTYDWIETDNPQRVIIKIFNIHDTNYFDPTYPYYVVGFYSSLYTIDYYNRNMIHIDNWAYWQRLGEEGHQWYPDHPELTVTRPYVYESTIAHEYQHNIHRDYQPGAETWMNEGCSMYAELVCGYGIDLDYFNYYFATPDNSLTVWGDQGDINIIADYGVVALWTTYLSDHYGGGDTIRQYVQSGVTGIEGVNGALAAMGYTETFDDVYHDWRLANLIRSDFPGCGKYNYESIDLNDPEIIPVRTYEVEGFFDWMKGTDFGTTWVWGDEYDTGVAEVGPYGTDYIKLYNWKKPGLISFDGDDTASQPYEWTWDGASWYSGAQDLMDNLMAGEAYVDPVNPTLEITTYWDIEDYWDFGFVQVSTDGGETWVSLENEYTTYLHDPSAMASIVANLPGLTSWSGFITPDGWVTMEFDLTDYAGQTVLIGFRYMTDWGTLYEGWYISEATVSGAPLELVPIYPEADFQVTVIYAFEIGDHTIYLPCDMQLDDETEEGSAFAFAKKPSYAILAVSPVMEKGFVDYNFSATKIRGRWHKIW